MGFYPDLVYAHTLLSEIKKIEKRAKMMDRPGDFFQKLREAEKRYPLTSVVYSSN